MPKLPESLKPLCRLTCRATVDQQHAYSSTGVHVLFVRVQRWWRMNIVCKLVKYVNKGVNDLVLSKIREFAEKQQGVKCYWLCRKGLCDSFCADSVEWSIKPPSNSIWVCTKQTKNHKVTTSFSMKFETYAVMLTCVCMYVCIDVCGFWLADWGQKQRISGPQKEIPIDLSSPRKYQQ